VSNVDLPVASTAVEQPARAAGAASKILRGLKLPALIAFIAAATNVAFDYFPDLRPDPQIQLNAALRAVAIEPDVTFGGYLRRIGRAPSEDDQPAQLRTTGNLFYVEAQTQGLKDEPSQLRWHLYNVKSGKRLANQLTGGAGWKTRSGTPSDRLIYLVWEQIPTQPGRYKLRFELRAKGVLLAIADSGAFDYCRHSNCGALER
jgi:hypothetical protein